MSVRIGLALSLLGLCLSSEAHALEALILTDADAGSASNTALADHLSSTGFNVTLSDGVWNTFDGTFDSGATSLVGSDIDVVILSAGLTYGYEMPDVGETAIMDFVHAGGGFVTTEFLNYFYDWYGTHADLRDLLLLNIQNFTDGNVNISMANQDNALQIAHQLIGIIASEIGYYSTYIPGTPRYTDVTVELVDDNNNPVLLSRAHGSGRVLNFNQAPGYSCYWSTCANDLDIFESDRALKMWEVAVSWAAGDDDFDGYNEADGDCDDTDDQVSILTWYIDADADGYGDTATTTDSSVTGLCTAPSGYVADSSDCDDSDGNVGGPATWYADSDGDGLGDVATTSSACAMPSGYVADSTDCDDTDATTAGPLTWYDDCDVDGYGYDHSYQDCIQSGMECDEFGMNCVDTWDCWDEVTSLSSCDEPTDWGFDGCQTWASNSDDCNDSDSSVYPSVMYADADGDGYGDAGNSTTVCSVSSYWVADATDCDDTDSNTNPGAAWEGCDVDWDCDGIYGEADPDFLNWELMQFCLDVDGDGDPSNTSCVEACSAPSAAYVAVCHPYGGDPEFGGNCYSGDTSMPYSFTYGPHWDCDDNDPTIYEGAPDLCDGLLNDCFEDNGINNVSADCDTSECTDMCGGDSTCEDQCNSGYTACYESHTGLADNESDLDGDGAVECTIDASGWDGDASVTRGDDCDDTDAAFVEATWYADLDGDGYGDSSTSAVNCSQSISTSDSGSESPALAIPDNDVGGIESSQNMAGCDGLLDVEVTIDITHTFIGDLTVELVNPEGTWVSLHNRTGGTTNDIVGTYSDSGVDLTPYQALANFSGQQSAGDWILVVTDLAGADTGTLNSWGLSLTCGGFSANGDDCDDSDAAITVEQTFYSDVDGDGFGDANTAQSACSAPSGTVSDDSDCDDADAAAYPGATEDTTDAIDQDCDGTAQVDADGDGYLSDVTGGDDCDDADASIYPGATEDLTDDVDSDCSGVAELDLDSDGIISNETGGEDCNDYDASVGILSWHYDGDQDTYGTADAASTHCEWMFEQTTICDGAHDMCMGSCAGDPICEENCPEDSCWEEGYETEYCGYPNVIETCTQPPATLDYYNNVHSYVPNNLDCDDSDQEINPDQAEACGDGLDNNCDGYTDNLAVDMVTWNIDYDGDGYGSASYTMEACAQPAGWVSDDSDCDDMNALNFPGADEYCDTVDNNCDGVVDEATAVDALDWFADTDGDGFGDAGSISPACDQPTGYTEDATDCDDTDATVGEPTAWYPDNDADGYGDIAAEVFECVAPTGHIAQSGDCDDEDDESYPGAEGFDEDCLEMKSSRCSTVPARSMFGWAWSVGLVALLRRRRKEQ